MAPVWGQLFTLVCKKKVQGGVWGSGSDLESVQVSHVIRGPEFHAHVRRCCRHPHRFSCMRAVQSVRSTCSGDKTPCSRGPVSPCSRRDCLKSHRSSYTELYPLICRATRQMGSYGSRPRQARIGGSHPLLRINLRPFEDL